MLGKDQGSTTGLLLGIGLRPNQTCAAKKEGTGCLTSAFQRKCL
jgi:hypothetical protein